MTPAKLQELAREAGLTIDGDSVRSPHLDCVALSDLARFAAVVRAAALEEAARVCDIERAARLESASANDGRQSDMSFGRVVCSEYLAEQFRALAQQAGGEAP